MKCPKCGGTRYISMAQGLDYGKSLKVCAICDKKMLTNQDAVRKQRLRAAMIKAGFDMDKIVDFWGKKMKLGDAIEKFDSGDIRDGYKMIAQKKMGLKFI